MQGRGATAFTLIELLIVIAIIAILALIAVPNFLEAQVRAKVSRCYADMRTIATATEAYTVDWGRPPIGNKEADPGEGANPPPSWGQFGRTMRAYIQMTTPVAYLSTVPKDYFNDKMKRVGSSGSYGNEDWFRFETASTNYLNTSTAMPDIVLECRARGVSWWIFSLGPTQQWAPPSGSYWSWAALAGRRDTATSARYKGFYYDATNGTMSWGRIVRSNLGQEPTAR